jgi:hypothetical protein
VLQVQRDRALARGTLRAKILLEEAEEEEEETKNGV